MECHLHSLRKDRCSGFRGNTASDYASPFEQARTRELYAAEKARKLAADRQREQALKFQGSFPCIAHAVVVAVYAVV